MRHGLYLLLGQPQPGFPAPQLQAKVKLIGLRNNASQLCEPCQVVGCKRCGSKDHNITIKTTS